MAPEQDSLLDSDVAVAPDSPVQENPVQEEMPFALVYGEAFTKLPQDLYIPPDALEVILEAFEGPLDLLLYLIKKQNLDILDIPVAQITAQYMEYVELMKSLNLELAAEYLVMAALLGEIKSRMLLPRQPGEEEEELDPRAELIRRLQEYERYKKAAEDIEVMPRVGREIHLGAADPPEYERPKSHPDVDLREVLLALQEVLHRADMFESHQVTREKLSTRERMTQVLERLGNDRFLPFVSLFSYEEGRLGVVVTFLAILELVKESLIELVQNEPFGPIHVRTRASAHEVGEEILDDNADESSVDDAYEVRTPALDAFSADHEGIELSAETLLEDATGPFDPAVLNYVESAEEAALEEALLREARLNEAGFVETHLVETGPAETGFDDPDQSIDPESSDPIRSDASDSSEEISEAARFEAEDSHSQRINRDPFASDTLSSHTVTNDATETAETEESDDVTR